MRPMREIDLKSFSTTKLAEIWNELNSWAWPEDLGNKPDGWDNLKFVERANIINPIVIKIEEMIGEKELLRYHHLNNLEHSNEEFEEWWKTEHKSFLAYRMLLNE
ncbi:hypothetical protein [Anaerotignum propionicum]|uniref:hypothetical protein n=1 Tax=Anaerotignum propionicum TaxID=28446 RepID=UPI00289B3208|nr:hypothetical protein [Anaerotignum propionicum]